MPTWSVAPSSTSAGDQLADARLDRRLGSSRAARAAAGWSGRRRATRDSGTVVAPRVRGIWSLISAIDQARVIGGGPGGVHRRAQRAEAVLVGRRELQQRDVERDPPAREQAGNLRQEDRDEVRAPLGDRLPRRAGADEEDTERIRPATSGSANRAGPEVCR